LDIKYDIVLTEFLVCVCDCCRVTLSVHLNAPTAPCRKVFSV